MLLQEQPEGGNSKAGFQPGQWVYLLQGSYTLMVKIAKAYLGVIFLLINIMVSDSPCPVEGVVVTSPSAVRSEPVSEAGP